MKRCMLCLLCAALAACFAACQRTPDKPVVLQKDMEQMIITAKGGAGTASSAPETPPETIDLYARLGAPAHYQAELQSRIGMLRVHVDAPLTLPACELPIVRVQQREITADEARLFARVLFGENPHYVENPYDEPTAAYCRKHAEAVRAAIDDWEGQGNIRYDMTYDTVEAAQAGLREWLARAGGAPDSLPAIEPDFSLQRQSVWTDEGEVQTTDTCLRLIAMPDDATISELWVENRMWLTGSASIAYVRDRDRAVTSLWGNDQELGALVSISEDAAYGIARQTADALGFAGFTCASRQRVLGDYRDWGAYGFVFTRSFLGVPETYTDVDRTSDEYKPPWAYERLSLLVDDGGVLQLWYDGPCTVRDTATDTARLLPFSDIQSVFEKMVLLVGNETEGNEMMKAIRLACDYYITDVRLGLMTVAEADGGAGLTVPVWDFLGYLEARSDADPAPRLLYTGRSHAFLTVNAVDGTVIDRTRGY